ncbi:MULTISPECIES: hypothetical protein [Marinomonas]|uniref:Outer membrane porin, OprD family n=1 Tax=Marinomonas rhodophyticola TaxID=2992803 RepID=A0ABT3KBD8_9GAMM|nr:hypothetical protein [Marinomonas sp. KJ51-3]MCW4627847.1 hypothetical protein [Marinomonas sp. KJ51-3]
MVKLNFKMALALSVVTSVNSHASTVLDSIKNGTFSGGLFNTLELGSNSGASGVGANNNAKVLGSALTLDYVTGDYYGFNIGVGSETGYDWGIQDSDTATTAGGENDSRVNVNATNLYRAFINYRFNSALTNTQIRVGRQDITSPLLMTSGAFPMRDSFDAVVIENKDIPDTILRAMYVTKWNMRYGDDNNGSVTQTDKSYDNPLVSFYLNNKSIDNLNIEAQWLQNDNDENAGDPPAAVTAKNYDTTFLALDYNIPNSSWTVGAKTLSANFENSADTGYQGAFVKNTFNGVGVQLAYTTVDDAANFPGTLGHVPMLRSYNPGMQGEYFAGLKTTSIAANYGFNITGFKATLGYTTWQQSVEGIKNSRGTDLDDGYEASLRIDYKSQEIKGLSTVMQLSYINYDQDVADDSLTILRTSLNYQF